MKKNRLIEAVESTLVDNAKKLQFTYDYMGRRIQKQVYAWDAASDLWSLTSDLRYVYDGWNLIEVLDATDSNSVAKTYTWGLDLSQSLQGAGGVGGLLAVTEHGETADTPYYTTYDANGNVSEYLESDGSVVAHYEYSPFGRLTLVDSETGAPDFNHRFSTKFFDTETRLYYYGLRFYNPDFGRWISRDPIQEHGGLNLYGFIYNQPLRGVDVLGQVLLIEDEANYDYILGLLKEIVKDENVSIWIVEGTGQVKCCHKEGKPPKHQEAYDCIEKAVTMQRWITIEVIEELKANLEKAQLGGEGDPENIIFPSAAPSTSSDLFSVNMIPEDPEVEFGFFDTKGKQHVAPLWRILAHELCGHAVAENNKSFNEKSGNRPSHDAAIKVENAVVGNRGKERGLFENPRQGESTWAKKENGEYYYYKNLKGNSPVFFRSPLSKSSPVSKKKNGFLRNLVDSIF